MDGKGAPHTPKLRGGSLLREAVYLRHGDDLSLKMYDVSLTLTPRLYKINKRLSASGEPP